MSPLRTVRVIALALSASLCLALGAVHLAPARAAEHARGHPEQPLTLPARTPPRVVGMTQADPDFRADRVGSALAGTNPTVLRRLEAGFAVFGDNQHLPGYCVLISDSPGVDRLTDLGPARQLVFLEDMAVLGRAVTEVCGRRDPAFRRINLEIQGNTDAFLHAHVTPRYSWEPADLVGWPAAVHHWEKRAEERPGLAPEYDDLRAELVAEIDAQQRLRGAVRPG